MVYDILEVFKKLYTKEQDNLILGAYSLKDGLYVRIEKDGSLQYFISKTVKKEKVFVDLKDRQNSNALEKFKQWDYYSSYLNSNKALFDKKIHNINYLSYFFKVENSDYVKEKIDGHFSILNSFEKFKDKKDKEVLERYEDILSNEDRKNDISKKSKLLKSKFDEIIEVAKNTEIKNYIKIFFVEDIETYKKESEIYLSLKIFNDSKYNEKIENEIYGLSNANMGLNSKKPFLENKTQKLNIPFMIENGDALMLKKFFDWLKLQPYRDEDNIPKDRYLEEEHFFMQKHSKNDESEITDFDYIPLKSDNVKKQFKSIYVKNHLKIEKNKELVLDYKINELHILEKTIDEVFYNKQLIFNYYKDGKDIKVSEFLSKELQNIVLATRFSMNNYFRKYEKNSFLSTIKKYASRLIIEHILQGWELKAKEALNLKISIIENEKKDGEKKMNIEEIENIMIKKLADSNYDDLACEQFFYLSGQVVSYLLSKKKQNDKTHELVEPFLRANNAQKLKKEIQNVFFQYKHALHSNAKRINNALTLIMAYEENEKLNQNTDSFLVGYLSSTKIFKSNEGENNE